MRYRICKKPERRESSDLRCDLHGPCSERKMVSSRMNIVNQRGSVLVMAAVLSFAMLLLGLAYPGFLNRALMDTDEMVTEIQSYYAAALHIDR